LRILNLGCGSSSYGDDRVDFIKTPTTTLVWDLEKGIPFPDETFDEVYSRNLLEHMRNVGFHLDECFRVLKKGGMVDITTDNAECTRYYWGGTHTGRYEKKHSGDHHYSIFTVNHLFNHFEKAGFRRMHVQYVKTDTIGKWIDTFTHQNPRLRVEAMK
jgi:predicted SAM-dependent methyltransferase